MKPSYLAMALCLSASAPWSSVLAGPDYLATDDPGLQRSSRIYRNPEERREAGLGTRVAPWLRFSGLFEFNKGYFEERFDNGELSRPDPPSAGELQLAYDISPVDWFGVELILEIDSANGYRPIGDEALIALELDPWGIKLGMQYVPFGEYYSHFVTGPMLEFGETRRHSLVLDYSPRQNLELAAYVMQNRVRQQGGDGPVDWGVNIDWMSDDEAVRLGAGYISDLGESEFGFLEDDVDNVLRHRVPAWNAYALVGMKTTELTAEIVKAKGNFSELERNEDSPLGVNLELAWFPLQHFQLAWRAEYSRELREQTAWRFGISTSVRLLSVVSVSLDYLFGIYRQDFVEDEERGPKHTQQQIALQASIEF